ncbi:hypothetical protein QBC46DRAFT_92459 [Diplogelasinospora grovesii]|uniref:NWD NACHT-NTPase N-terminal domain-containing protein n=1 Tax=Diplogelasinospora grovesii TaxID=303347 RepID=A0AAN6MW63_9PEZI|nr:hypothetical protein QBC46DRAFT_92459 [Diplogelasinospora grovesii]
MAGDSSCKNWWKRLRPGGRDSAKSKTQDSSLKYDAVSSSANSPQANVVLHPPEQTALSTTTVPSFPQSTESTSAPAVPSAPSNTALRTSVNNTGNTAAEISQTVAGDQAANVTKDLATDGTLWDKAYDTLKGEKDDLIVEYENLLSKVLIRAQTKTPSAPNETEDVSEVTSQIPQHDTIARREKLKELTKLGLKRMDDKKVSTTLLGHEIVLQDVVANVTGAVRWAEDYLKDAVKDLPYASIVVAGVSLVLPLLKTPTAVEAANKEGFTYVTSQMRYSLHQTYGGPSSVQRPDGLEKCQRAPGTC